jgi:hypothetical protein
MVVHLEGVSRNMRVYGANHGAGRHQHGAHCRAENHSPMRQNTRRCRDRDDVVTGGPDQVLDHLAVGSPGETDDRGDIMRVAFDENDVSRFNGDIRAGADGNADISLRERRRIVHTIACHGDNETSGLHLLDLGDFLVWKHLGDHFVEANFFDADQISGIPIRAVCTVAGKSWAKYRE